MLKIYVDGVALETLEQPEVVISYDAESTRDVESARSGRMVEVALAVNDRNEAIFAGEGYMHAQSRFNAAQHTAAVEYDGEVIVEGAVTLRSLGREGAVSRYTLLIEWASGAWAEMAATQLISLLPVDFSIYLRQADIIEAWEDETQPVQFFPVHRDDYESESSSASLEVVRKIRGIDDYHPFLKVDRLLHSIAEQSGYTLESEFLESEEFRTLYMSGDYESQQNTTARAAMDFKVGRCESESAIADYSGRVTISPYVAANAISTIVDIESLEQVSGCFESNDCLSVVDGAVVFTPTTQVSVGFEFRLRYIADYKILSRTRLCTFDNFYFGVSPIVKVEIANLFTDERDSTLQSGLEYLVVVFDHVEGTSYRLVGCVNGASTTTTLATWSSRTTRFSKSFTTSLTNLVVQVASGSSYTTLTDDWALYQGYVEEEGDTEIDLTIRTSPDSYSPTSPRSFGVVYMEGAEEGMSLTLLEGTTITPYFSGYPGYGEEVVFEDLAQLGERQDTLVESVMQLFNLRFFVDERARKIYLEPLDTLYDESVIWDWSDRVVDPTAMTFEDCALDLYRCRTWGYQAGDGTTNRITGFTYIPGSDYPDAPEAEPAQSDVAAYSPEYGAWQRGIVNYASRDGDQSILNPLYSPSQSTLSDILIVGDRDDEESYDTLEFSPRVARWCGTNSSGEPSVSFHNATAGHTLCFEDRDGVAGLNKYYTRQIEQEERGQYVTLSLRLSPNELAALYTVVDGMPSLLSCFRFRLQGESVLCRIEAIEEYRVGGDGVAKCKFLILK